MMLVQKFFNNTKDDFSRFQNDYLGLPLTENPDFT